MHQVTAAEVQRWSTAEHRQADRIEAWSDMLTHSHLPWRLSETPDEGFSSEVAMRQFNGYRLISCACDASRGERSVNEIAQTDGHAVSLLYVRSGMEVITIEEQELILQAGDLVLWDSERPMTFNVRKHLEKLTIMFPEAALTSVFPNAADHVGSVVSRGKGLSAILGDYLEVLRREMWDMSQDDLTAAMKPTMDLLATVLTMESKLEPRTIKSITLARTKEYIVKNLDDEVLSPRSIADAIGITPRYLHLLFEEVGVTVSQWIKERRLERCKDDMVNSQVTGKSITEIAYARGFNHLSHFSKSFKHQYGMSPRAFVAQSKAAAPRTPIRGVRRC